jgi:hypothetical protein
MLALRKLDGPGLRSYLDDVRPRVLVVRIRSRRRRWLWAVPMAPFEAIVAFAIGAALLASAGLALLARTERGPWQRLHGRLAAFTGLAGIDATGSDASRPLARLLGGLSALAGSHPGGLLRLPAGEPYVRVRWREGAVDLTPY